MKQAIMMKPGEVTIREVDIPEIAPNQIKVKMKRIGVCGSDIHVFHGKHPYTSYPVVQGHEVAAKVVEIGSEVTSVKIGDRVTIQPQVVCGKCYPCTHGRYNACEELKVMGFQTTGMASEYFVTEADKAVKLSEGMSYDEGALVEPISVAVHAIRRYGNVAGKKVLVLGGGPIGNLVAQSAKAMGASQVLVSEQSTARLDIAKGCEIETVNPLETELLDKIIETFGTDKADVIFECVGINATMEQAINFSRKGSDIVVVGVFADFGTINMGLIQDKELRLIGSAMYRVEDYEKAIELIKDDLLCLKPLITHRIKFENFQKAYETIELNRDKAMKVMVDFE